MKAYLNLVPIELHAEFLHFVKTGDGSEEFFEMLANDDNLLRAADLAFLEELENFGQSLIEKLQPK